MASGILDTSELSRLLRDDWNKLGVQAFAEELFTTLGGRQNGGQSTKNSGNGGTGVINGGQWGPAQIATAAGLGTPTNAATTESGVPVQGPTAFQGENGGPSIYLLSVNSDGSPADPSLVIDFGNGTQGELSFDLSFGLQLLLGDINAGFNLQVGQMVPVQDGKVQLFALEAAVPAVVLSGSGQTYSVTIYENGRDNPGRTVSAEVIQTLATDETVPVGTECLAVKSGTKYYLNMPVWL